MSCEIRIGMGKRMVDVVSLDDIQMSRGDDRCRESDVPIGSLHGNTSRARLIRCRQR